MSTDYADRTTSLNERPLGLARTRRATSTAKPTSETSEPGRRIGPVATASRVVLALVLLYVAGGADGLSWSIEWSGAAVGLVALPALTVLVGLAARRHARRPLRLTGPLAHLLNCAVIVGLTINPDTAEAAAVFYASALLVAAWRGQPGCEVTVLSNWVLGRDDEVGCPLFAPIDAAEAKYRRPTRPRAARP